jgi:catalase
LVQSIRKPEASAVVVVPKGRQGKAVGRQGDEGDGQPLQIFDAVAVRLSKEGTAMLLKESAAEESRL